MPGCPQNSIGQSVPSGHTQKKTYPVSPSFLHQTQSEFTEKHDCHLDDIAADLFNRSNRIYLCSSQPIQQTKKNDILSRLLLFRLAEAEAKASESHLQLSSRQPGRADLLRRRGDRRGWRGGPGVVGQYRVVLLFLRVLHSPTPRSVHVSTM